MAHSKISAAHRLRNTDLDHLGAPFWERPFVKMALGVVRNELYQINVACRLEAIEEVDAKRGLII